MKTTRRNILTGGLFLVMLIGVTQAQELNTEKSFPLSITAGYTLASDYVWRGVNRSEYTNEGHEMVNHQATVGVSMDLKDAGLADVGTIRATVWTEVYAGQKALGGSSHVQELDYTLAWSCDIPDTALGVELGWIAYTYPAAGGGDRNKTYEVFGKISYSGDGEFLADQEESLLNPYLKYYYDYDEVDAGWLELGISHEFDLAEVSEGLNNLTAVPSIVIGIDNSYWDEKTRLGNIEYGLDIAYDLAAALNMPEEYGSVGVTGFIKFSDGLGDARLNNELYGGISVGYSW
ncbi:MAG: hypothetical protein J7M14_01465 [Planctomycetes bacterium]|nr:hypothetical protein [Planctomycetota bacterium]